VVEGLGTEAIILRGCPTFGGQPSWIVTTKVQLCSILIFSEITKERNIIEIMLESAALRK
jgi:hypothetical protein